VRLRLRLVPSRVRFVIGLLQWCRLQQKVTVYNHTLNLDRQECCLGCTAKRGLIN
jgi:hypothetical protein